MDRVTEKLKGCVRVRILGSFPEAVLNSCAMNAVPLWGISCENDNMIQASVYESDLEALRDITRSKMCEIEVIGSYGGSRTRRAIWARLTVIVILAVTAAALCASGLFIWEIDIRGNENISESEILRALSRCGVECGTFWPGISSDMVRAQMTELIPEIGWMTVNVNGSRAIVLITERIMKPEIYNSAEPKDIVAGKTGIVERISVFNGKREVSRGQAVIRGERLISGTMDSITNGSRYVCAKGEVWAKTGYIMCSAQPLVQEIKTASDTARVRYAVIVGKRRINLYFSSGNTIDGCDKISRVYNLGVDGLFSLPVSIVREELMRYSCSSETLNDTESMKNKLSEMLDGELNGRIVKKTFSASEQRGLCLVTLRAQCFENIALDKDME